MLAGNLEKIILIGAGNLAWHIGPALQDAGYTILQVYNRSVEPAKMLAESLGVKWTMDAESMDPQAEILLFCITESAIPEIFCRIESKKKPMMVHTSGSVPMDVFQGIAREYGVLYPLMTFTKGRSLNFHSVPVCIEGNTSGSNAILEKMARGISNRVYKIDSKQRMVLHLAGIVASNFSNHMFHLSSDFLEDKGIDFELLKPLIKETASKALEMDPAAAQTGPASRNDADIIRDHIDLLKDNPELQKLYTFVSDSITNHFKAK